MKTSTMMSGWSVSLLVLVGLSHLLRDWRDLQLAFTLASLLPLSFLALQESPRWLLAKGKHQEAAAVLRYEVTQVSIVRAFYNQQSTPCGQI